MYMPGEVRLSKVREVPLFYPASFGVLFIAWLSYVVDMFMRYNIPTAIPYLRHAYGWNAQTVGWLDASYLWAYAIVQVPWGYVSEKWLHGKLTIILGTALMVVASVAFAFHVSNLWFAIASRAVIGAGAGAIGVAVNPVLARWFAPGIRGLQTGLWATGGPIGTGLGGALMPILLTGSLVLFGLSPIETGFLYSAVPGLLIIAIVLFFMRNRPEDIGLVSLDSPQNSGQALAVDTTEAGFGSIMRGSIHPYILGIVYSGFIGTKYFVWTWFAVFLATRYHLNPRSAGFLWAFVAAVPPVLMQPVAGWLSDRFGRVRCIVAALLTTAALACVLMIMSISGGTSAPLWMLITIAGLFSVTVNMWVMVWPLTTIMFPTAAGGAIGGFMNTFAQVVGALAPVVSGYFIDIAGNYTPAFAAGVLCSLVAAGCALFLKERRVI
jgi:ACS family D-galactonate transporter-like MFS transporter